MPNRRRSRRDRLAAVAVALGAVVVPLGAPAPAGAVTAPLVTTDGVGLRIDETAVQGAPLEVYEDALQVVAEGELWNGPGSVPYSTGTPSWTGVDAEVELAYDAIAAGTAGYPQGGVRLHAEIQDIEIRYVMSAWWHSDCSIWVRPDDTTIDVASRVDATLLPATPFAPTATVPVWDPDPTISTNGACWTYLPATLSTSWWAPFVDPTDPASMQSMVDAAVEQARDDLLDELWHGNVAVVLDSLTSLAGFGITPNQLRTDAGGLVVTADVDATGGVDVGGTLYGVAGAQDSGATSNVTTLLAQRTLGGQPADIIVSIHPNVVNQHLEAVTAHLGGAFSGLPVSAGVELPLLNPAHRASYPDGAWSAALTGTAPHAQPTGAGGRPQLRFPAVDLELVNTSWPPVSTFSGSLTGVATVALPTPCCAQAYDAFPASFSATRTQADALASLRSPVPTGADLAPWAREAAQAFLDGVPAYVDLALAGVAGHGPSLCACPRHPGDQRVTEVLTVG